MRCALSVGLPWEKWGLETLRRDESPFAGIFLSKLHVIWRSSFGCKDIFFISFGWCLPVFHVIRDPLLRTFDQPGRIVQVEELFTKSGKEPHRFPAHLSHPVVPSCSRGQQPLLSPSPLALPQAPYPAASRCTEIG